jgi:integrase
VLLDARAPLAFTCGPVHYRGRVARPKEVQRLGSIRRHRSKWQARYRDPDGNVRGKSFARKLDARRFLAEIEADKLRGAWIDPKHGHVHLEAFWTAHLLPHLETLLRPTTLDLYERLWRRYIRPSLGGRPISSIRPADIQETLGRMMEQGVGRPTVNATFRLLSRVLKSGVNGGFIPRNPAERVSTPTVQQKEMRFLDLKDISHLSEAAPDEWKAFLLVAIWGGLRFGEISALRTKDIDFLRRQIRIEHSITEVNGRISVGPTKNKGRRVVAMPTFVIEALAAHLNQWPATPEGFIFRSPTGGYVRRSNFRQRVWLPTLKQAGIEGLRFHDLRHTAAALAIAVSAHPKALQARLGHSSITTTLDRYGHLMEGLDQRLAIRLQELRDTATPASPQETQSVQ